jgi:hypothetical protein
MKGVFILLLFSCVYAQCSSTTTTTTEDTFAENIKRVFLYGFIPVLTPSKKPSDCETSPKTQCEPNSGGVSSAWHTFGVLLRVHTGWTLPWASLCHFQCCNRLDFNPTGTTTVCIEATQQYKDAIVSLSWIIPKLVVLLVTLSVVTTLVFCSTLCCT